MWNLRTKGTNETENGHRYRQQVVARVEGGGRMSETGEGN